MALSVRTPWGEEEYPKALTHDVDRDRDLYLYDIDGEGPIAVYAAGQWLRVRSDGTSTG